MTDESTSLTDFINAVKNGIKNSQEAGSFELLTPIEFEVTVATTKEGKAGLNIVVVGAGGKYEKESVSKIKFSMGHPLSLEQLEKVVKVWQIQSKISNETIETFLKTLKS